MNGDGTVKSNKTMWTWIGCGCGAIVAVALAVIVTITWFGYRTAKSFEADMKDPVARAERSQSLLGYQELPAGYHPAGGFELPFVVEMAMLTDLELPAGELIDENNAFGKSGFVYLKLRGMSADDKRRLEDYLEGRSDENDFFGIDRSAVRFERGDVIGRGRVAVAGGTARYVAQEGSRRGGAPSLVTVVAIDCTPPPDSRQRIAVWFEAVAEAADPAQPYLGTPADEGRLGEFLGHFQFCR